MSHVALVLALTAAATTATKRKQSDSPKSRERPSAEKTWWRYQVVLQPLALSLGSEDPSTPGIELQSTITRNANRPTSIAFAYWFNRHSQKRDADEGIINIGDEKHDRVAAQASLDAAVARYMLYLTTSFHFNFGAGVRMTSAKETLTQSDGATLTASKSATVMGAELGLGNRWVLDSGLVIGGTWVQFFVPIATLAAKDAEIPEGYKDGSGIFDGRSKKNDGQATSWRAPTLDIGWAF